MYYRLSVVKVHLPALRERPEDLPIIIKKFLENGRFNQLPDGKFRVVRIEDDAMKTLQRYQWPGNVRELANVIERAVSMSDSDTISASSLAFVFQEMEHHVEPTERMEVDTSLPFKEAKQKIVEVFEKDYLEELLQRNNYNVSKASREAKIDRKHLRNLLKKYGINAPDGDEEE